MRRQRVCGKHIPLQTGVSAATVSRVLAKVSLSRLSHREQTQQVLRYVREHRGGLIHLDIKPLVRFKAVSHRLSGNREGQSKRRGAGWEYLQVCIDDASRVSYPAIFPDQKAASASAFLAGAVAYYKRLGVTVTRFTTDSGACYKAFAFSDACRHLGLRHIRTKPSTLRTDGKAERFIRTILIEWAYARACTSSVQRAAQLPFWTNCTIGPACMADSVQNNPSVSSTYPGTTG